MKKIELTKGYFAIIDDQDLDLIKDYKWCIGGRGYALTWGKGNKRKRLQMHRLIMRADKNQFVDHINHNKLDNRRCNLRFATRLQNQANRLSNKNTISKFKGVTWHKQAKRWQAQVQFESKNKYLGLFVSEQEAAMAYDKTAKKLFGEFAHLNYKP